MEEALRQAVETAAGRPEVAAAVRAVYDAVATEIAVRQPVCVMSGRCCHFEEYGHRLYVTTIELAAFASQLPVVSGQWPVKGHSLAVLATDNAQPATAALDGSGCPFQVGKRCGVHSIRPFGCRMFFCDPTSTEWQNDAYERFHAEIKAAHERMAVPYFYLEWRAALRMLGWAVPAEEAHV